MENNGKMRRNNITHLPATVLLAVIVLLPAALTSCLQKNGDIGPWFGSWYLEEILINGEPDAAYESNKANRQHEVMVNFQGDIFNMAYIGGSEVYGSWSYAGEILTLVASEGEGSGFNSPLFNPYPQVMHFPADEYMIEITVRSMTSKKMEWQYIDQNGRLLTYNFVKYP